MSFDRFPGSLLVPISVMKHLSPKLKGIILILYGFDNRLFLSLTWVLSMKMLIRF